MPLLSLNRIVGIIRFHKKTHTFHNNILYRLYHIEDALVKIFSKELDDKTMQSNETLFSVDANQVHNRLHTIRSEIKQLYLDAHNPEIKKIIDSAEEIIGSIYDYIHFNQDITLAIDLSPSKLHILIADDVQLNVKILNAILKGEPDVEISFAYDGIETLEKIEQLRQDNNPVDILYLDHYMPGKLGLEVAQTIRKEELGNLTHKMIIVSITNDPNAIKEQEHLYDYHISKPFVKLDVDLVMKHIRDI